MKSNNSILSDRMKKYENVTTSYLIAKTPIIIRFNRNISKDGNLIDGETDRCMLSTMKFLVDSIPNVVMGYVCFENISLFLRDYGNVNLHPWLDNNIQKIVSYSSSICTTYFNIFNKGRWETNLLTSNKFDIFDVKTFNLPKEEVFNYFLWQQNLCKRKAIQRIGSYHLGEKNIQGLKNNEILEKLDKINIKLTDMPFAFDKGVCYTKGTENVSSFICRSFDEKIEKEYLNSLIYYKENFNGN